MSFQKVEIGISGVVQGVGFRYFAYRQASQIGLVGWVRNVPDGRVQLVAEGERGSLEILIKELSVGPASASVHNVNLQWSEATGEFKSFEIR